MIIWVSFGEPSSHPPGPCVFHIEDHAQRDGDIETMAIRALHKAKFLAEG